MKKTFYLVGFLGLAAMVSCKKNVGGFDENSVNKIAPNGFNYKTSKDVNINLQLLTVGDQPLSNVIVSVYNTASTDPADAIYKGITDANGNLKASVSVASSANQLIIDPSYVGLLRNVTVNINSNAVTATIGGKNAYSGDVVPDAINNKPGSSNGSSGGLGTLGLNTTDYVYPAPYSTTASAVVNSSTYPSNLGRPAYLEPTGDVIETSLLNYVNASLPEGRSILTTHPEYLNSGVANINVTTTSDVYITYVTETTSAQSTLAYYTYPTGNPPTKTSGGTSASGIDKVTMIFPNSSNLGSGGGLNPGDKVKLGNFPAGTTIAFVLLAGAWNGSGVDLNAVKFYSDNQFNPEADVNSKKHSVLLYDDVHKLYLVGFDDYYRDGRSDNDFNDLVFYATSTATNAISNVGVSPVDKGGDTDGDGVQDVYDAFPNDPTKAYIVYFPSQNGLAQLAFEDNWPNKGDYDMNDLVVNYRYTFVANSQGNLVTLQGDFSIAASGASYHNGFGVQLPFAASTVKSVTGQKTIGNYIQFASNGVEAGQSKAVIIPFDNHEALLHYPDYSYLINTLNEKDKAQSLTASVLVTFNSPVSTAGLSTSSINPFAISDTRRGYEIHLPGYEATDKANKTLFATADDASQVNGRINYTSKENWPWAISFNDTSFKYPLERVIITDAYPHFSEWAGSNGTNFKDWYSNLTTGFRNNSKIYNK